MKDVSIIICFYNAALKLKETLESIKRINIDGFNVELILVNNNSKDNSEDVVKSVMDGFEGFPWRIIKEIKPGLTYARLKGINDANYNQLLFCDDDNWLARDYLQIGLGILKKNNKIAVLGGRGEAVSTIEIPIWFSNVENYYAVGKQVQQSGRVFGNRNVVYGAGMFVRKDYFFAIYENGYKPFSKDRVGNSLSSGGDSEMCLAFQIAGYDIWYSEQLKFKHYIEEKRLTFDYLEKLQKGINESAFVSRFFRDYLNGYSPNITKYFWFKEYLNSLFDTLKMFLSLNLNIKRNLKFQFFLLKERSNYDKNVKTIINMCNQLHNTATYK